MGPGLWKLGLGQPGCMCRQDRLGRERRTEQTQEPCPVLSLDLDPENPALRSPPCSSPGGMSSKKGGG